MMKRKKKIWIISVSMVCVFSILLSLYYFLPYPKHRVSNREANDTELFLPEPDSMIYIENGIGKKLSQEQKDKVYASFMQAVERVQFCSAILGQFRSYSVLEYIGEYPCVEFRYEQRQRFHGIMEGEQPNSGSWGGTFEFDAILLAVMSKSICVIGYRNGKYTGIGSRYSTHAFLDFYPDGKEVYENFKEVVCTVGE